METRSEVMESLNKNLKKRDELHTALKRSLAIQGIWPEAKFPVSSWVQGGQINGFKMYVSDKNGSVKTFELKEIPEELLLAPHIQKAIRHMHKHNNPLNGHPYKYKKYIR